MKKKKRGILERRSSHARPQPCACALLRVSLFRNRFFYMYMYIYVRTPPPPPLASERTLLLVFVPSFTHTRNTRKSKDGYCVFCFVFNLSYVHIRTAQTARGRQIVPPDHTTVNWLLIPEALGQSLLFVIFFVSLSFLYLYFYSLLFCRTVDIFNWFKSRFYIKHLFSSLSDVG